TLFPYTTLFRSWPAAQKARLAAAAFDHGHAALPICRNAGDEADVPARVEQLDRVAVGDVMCGCVVGVQQAGGRALLALQRGDAGEGGVMLVVARRGQQAQGPAGGLLAPRLGRIRLPL